MQPSTEWKERIEPGEEQRFQAYSDKLVEVQVARDKRYGNGRALHRRQRGALHAELEVLGGLPDYAAQGLFATPGRHEAWVRLSNGSFDVAPDKKPDVRGFAIKVRGVSGEGALGGTTSCQDFLLINRTTVGFTRPEPFFDLILAGARGPLHVIWLILRTYGLIGGLKKLRELKAAQDAPFAGFAIGPFWSAVPIACGPYAARLRLVPAAPQPPAANPDDWEADIGGRLATGPLVYELQLQFFVDETRTPIEDGAVDWSERVAPYVTVARLTVPQQDLNSADGRKLAEEVAAHKFDPWQALVAHRPLGAIQRARKVAYYASQKTRGAV